MPNQGNWVGSSSLLTPFLLQNSYRHLDGADEEGDALNMPSLLLKQKRTLHGCMWCSQRNQQIETYIVDFSDIVEFAGQYSCQKSNTSSRQREILTVDANMPSLTMLSQRARIKQTYTCQREMVLSVDMFLMKKLRSMKTTILLDIFSILTMVNPLRRICIQNALTQLSI